MVQERKHINLVSDGNIVLRNGGASFPLTNAKGYVNSDQFRLPFNNKSQFTILKYPALLAFIFIKSFTQKMLQRLLKDYNDKKKLKLKKKQEKGTLCYHWISCSDYLQIYDKRREDLDKNCDWSNKV